MGLLDPKKCDMLVVINTDTRPVWRDELVLTQKTRFAGGDQPRYSTSGVGWVCPTPKKRDLFVVINTDTQRGSGMGLPSEGR